ncbi:MAG TPA: aminoacyl-tRNA hydrolase [Gammaproteobacteria bacterium]|nr:aminoacyl-tRNA hydrolase [Gammaproteobacteria bacterium]
MKVIVGLGNPGDAYAKTRHNVGQWLIDQLAASRGVVLKDVQMASVQAVKTTIEAHSVWLVKTESFMNVSGLPVRNFLSYYRIKPEDLYVVYDDLDFECGVVRYKMGGGAGGHNGIKDISRHIGKDFHRLRVGIGHPGDASLVSSYVLKAPNAEDRVTIQQSLTQLEFCLAGLMGDDRSVAIEQLHSDS